MKADNKPYNYNNKQDDMMSMTLIHSWHCRLCTSLMMQDIDSC